PGHQIECFFWGAVEFCLLHDGLHGRQVEMTELLANRNERVVASRWISKTPIDGVISVDHRTRELLAAWLVQRSLSHHEGIDDLIRNFRGIEQNVGILALVQRFQDE